MTCLILGPIISFVTSGLKRIPYVKDHPKVIALVLSVLYQSGQAVYSYVHPDAPALDLGAFISCVLSSFGVAVGTHEVIQPISNALGLSDASKKPAS